MVVRNIHILGGCPSADADGDMFEGVLSEKLLSGTCPYFEDILHPPLVPDGDHSVWDHSLNLILPEVSKYIKLEIQGALCPSF